MGSSLNLALPQIGRELGLHSVEISWILTSYLLSTAILQVPFGRLADIWGKREVFIIGLLIFAISTILSSFSTSALMLITLRSVQGVGSAMIFSTNTAIIASVFPANERGMAMGINAATVYLAAAMGPSLGGFITESLGWQYIFVIPAVIAVMVFIASLVIMKESWQIAKGEPFDLKGSVIYGLSITSLIYGLTILPQTIGIALIVLSIVLLLVFARLQQRTKHPVFNIDLLMTNKVFRMSSASALINYAATFPIAFLISLYLQEVKLFDPRTAGLILIMQPALQAILSPFMGKLSDRVQPRYLASGGMTLITLVLGYIALFLTPETSVVSLLIMLGLLGVGFAAFSSPNMNAIMGSVEAEHYSMASATTGTVRLTGQSLSMGITTLIIAVIIGKQAITPELSRELMSVIHITFGFFALFCAFGVYTSMARGKSNLINS